MNLALAGMFCLGLIAGAVWNWAIYGLAYDARPYSPWSRSHPRDATSGWADPAPLFGWWRLRRRSREWPRGFWIRPLLIELSAGLTFAGLYWWEVEQAALLADLPVFPLPIEPAAAMPLDPTFYHAMLAGHLLLFSLMAVATWIDIDEQTIPDAITVPGTLLGLVLATAWPWILLPAGGAPLGDGNFEIEYVTATAPQAWPDMLAAAPQWRSLLIGLGCFWLWCVGLLPRRWYGRHGVRRGVQLITARIARSPLTALIGGIAVVGGLAIAGVWWLAPVRWLGLSTALFGLAGGGLLVWVTRVIAGWALKKEAMGFGDVTLLAMIGVYLGWQPCLFIFFLAPFAGVIFGVIQLLQRGDHVIPYGPYLCLAAAAVVLFWPAFWNRGWPFFQLGWLVPAVVVGCMMTMGLMLGLWRLLLTLLGRGRV